MSIKGNAEGYSNVQGKVSFPETIQGKSAYESAITGGFKGTEEEWIASLKGEKGDTGDKGDKGDKGDTGEKGDKGDLGGTAPVVQTTGNNEAAVMSQAVVTVELENAGQRIAVNDKRITNLEKGLMADSFETDDSVAYIKDVPTNALPYAAISKIGGMTRKCANLIPFPYEYESKETYGVTYTVQKDGGIRIKGTCSQGTSMTIFRTGLFTSYWRVDLNQGAKTIGDYCASLQGSCAVGTSSRVLMEFETFAGGGGHIFIWVYAGETYDCIVYPMLNEGSTALPYEPYFEGLRYAPVTEVKSVGANKAILVNGKHNLDNRIDLTVNNGHVEISTAVYEDYFYDKWKPYTTLFLKAGTYNFSLQNRALDYDTELGAFQVNILDAATGENICNLSSNLSKHDNWDFVIDKDKEVYIASYTFNNTGKTITFSFDIMISKGGGRKDFTEPTVHTLPIPSGVQALDGYGEGLNETYYNYVSWNADGSVTFNKVTRKVELTGKESWDLGSTSNSVTEYNRYICYDFSAPFETTKHCSHFKYLGDTVSAYNPNGEGLASGASGSYNYSVDFAFRKDGSFPTLDSFKAYLAQQYAAGTPVTVEFLDRYTGTTVIDISDLISKDNLIGVEGGGDITMVNEHEYAVPSEIIYQLKGESA